MDKLDRLGWAATMTLESYGVRVGLRTNHPTLLPEVTERLPPGWKATKGRIVDRLYSLRIFLS